MSRSSQHRRVRSRRWGPFAVLAVVAGLVVSPAFELVAPPTAEAVFQFECESEAGIAYFVNTNSGTVSLVYTGTNTNVGNVDVGGGTPFGVTSTPDGSRVYVAGAAGGVRLIDTSTYDTSAIAAPAGAPWTNPVGAWSSPDGSKSFVTNFNANRVTVIDTATNTATGSITLPGAGPEVYTGPGYVDGVGTRLYVARDVGSYKGYVEIDMNTNQVVREVRDPNGGHSIAANDPFVAVATNPGRVISVRNRANGSAVRTITLPTTVPGGVHGITFVPGTNYIVAPTLSGSNTPGRILVYDASTGALVNNLQAGSPNMRVPIASPLDPVVYLAGTANDNVGGSMDLLTTSGDPSTWTVTRNQTPLQNNPDGHSPAFSCLQALGGTKTLADPTLRAGETTQLTVTLENYNVQPSAGATGAAFTDDLPAGLVVADEPNLVSTCGPGAASAPPGGSTVALTGGTVPAAIASGTPQEKTPGQCTVVVDVTATDAAGSYTNSIPAGEITADGLPASIDAVTNDFSVYAEPTVAAQKDFPDGRYAPDDQFTVSVSDDGGAQVATGTTTGDDVGLQDGAGEVAGPVTATEGTTYTFEETPAAGADGDDYLSSYVCSDPRNDDAQLAAGDGRTVDVTVPDSDADLDVRCTFTNEPVAPALELTKSAGDVTDVDQNGRDSVGDTVTYSFSVENTGNVPLDPVVVDDPLLGDEQPCGTGPLAPGDTRSCPDRTYTLTLEDIRAGGVDNTAMATGTAPNDDDATDDDTVEVDFDAVGELALEKTAGEVVDADGDGVDSVGDTVTYSFLVTNTGNVSLDPVAVSDPLLGEGAVTCDPDVLAPGDEVTCTAAPYVLTQDDVDAGEVENTATATGTPPDGEPVTGEDTVTVDLTREPGLAIDKTATLDDANGNGLADVGETIAYSFTVTNTGNVTLDPVTVDDPLAGDVTCAPTALAPGEDAECDADAPYEVTQADVDAGSVDNSATATGVGPAGNPVESDPDETSTDTSAADPDLTITKIADWDDADGDGAIDVGETIGYSFLVENTGNVSLDPVTVDDDLAGAVTCPAGPVAPGGSTLCTADADYVVDQGDVDAGEVVNTATATGAPPTGDPVTSEPDSTTTPGEPTPGLQVEATATLDDADGDGQADAGETISYTYVVTNTGNTTLTGVGVTDPATGLTFTCAPTTLGPGEQATCTAVGGGTRVVTADDVASGGPITSSATATADGPGGAEVDDTDTTSVPVAAEPGVELVKTATLDDANGNGGADAGETISYSFLVTNSGNVTLRNVAIDDPTLAGTVTCTPNDGPVAPGQTRICTADQVRTVTVDEVDEAEDGDLLVNTATASADAPDGTEVESAEDSATVEIADAAPSLSIEKSSSLADADGDDELDVGEEISYSFVLTNTGNVTIEDVSVNDSLIDDAVTCPAASLPPGGSTTCTSDAPYVVTQADADAGEVVNTASASGLAVRSAPGEGPEVDSAPDSVTTPGPSAPAVRLDKSAELDDANGDGRANEGERIEFSFTVTNTGGVTVTDVAVSDPMLAELGAVDCEVTRLAPGESTGCSTDGPYVVTGADVDAGEVRNVATARAQVPDEDPVRDRDRTVTPAGPGNGPGGGPAGGPGQGPISGGPGTGPGGGLLPDTGGPAWWAAVLGLLALAGGGLLIASRRRRTGTT